MAPGSWNSTINTSNKHHNHQKIIHIKTALLLSARIRKKHTRGTASVFKWALCYWFPYMMVIIGAQHGHTGNSRVRWATGIIQYLQARNIGLIKADRERESEREHCTNIHPKRTFKLEFPFINIHPLTIRKEKSKQAMMPLFLLLLPHTEVESNCNSHL